MSKTWTVNNILIDAVSGQDPLVDFLMYLGDPVGHLVSSDGEPSIPNIMIPLGSILTLNAVPILNVNNEPIFNLNA